jgi:hypothetical protein
MDNLLQSLGELLGKTGNLACEAERQYSTEVEYILEVQSRDSGRIEKGKKEVNNR